MPVETAKCWRLLKIEPNAWAGGKGSCAVCVDLQAVGALEFFGEFYSLAKGFGPFLRGVWAGFREREGSIFSNHQHFAVSTGICGVACPLLLYALGHRSSLQAHSCPVGQHSKVEAWLRCQKQLLAHDEANRLIGYFPGLFAEPHVFYLAPRSSFTVAKSYASVKVLT